MRLSEFDPYFSLRLRGAIIEDMIRRANTPTEEPFEDDLFEMANLVQGQTGISGIIYISTSQGSHASRVKYFEKTGKGQPGFSVSIGPNPKVVARSPNLPNNTRAMEPLVIAWVKLNHQALPSFWNNGTSWTDPQVTQFKASLKKYSFE